MMLSLKLALTLPYFRPRSENAAPAKRLSGRDTAVPSSQMNLKVSIWENSFLHGFFYLSYNKIQ